MAQEIIAIVIIAAAVVYALIKIISFIKSPEPGCGCESSKCGSCPVNDKTGCC